MKLILKFLIKDLLFFGIIAYILYRLNIPSYETVITIIGVCYLCQMLFSFKLIIHPVLKLYYAIKGIDFNKINDEPIDFRKLDNIVPRGNSEMNVIIKKFKHLVDILCSRISSLNYQVDISTHDALSGCYNVEYWNQMKNNYASQKSVCIVFIDVNNLKRMNDTYGHEAGDTLIKTAARKLEWWKGKGDVFRMGGDEFMVVITNQTKERCKKLITDWYPTVGRMNRDTDAFACVMSYGVAYGHQFCNIDELKKTADDRMYQHKVKIKQALGEPMR